MSGAPGFQLFQRTDHLRFRMPALRHRLFPFLSLKSYSVVCGCDATWPATASDAQSRAPARAVARVVPGSALAALRKEGRSDSGSAVTDMRGVSHEHWRFHSLSAKNSRTDNPLRATSRMASRSAVYALMGGVARLVSDSPEVIVQIVAGLRIVRVSPQPLWRKKRCSCTAQDVSVLTASALLSMGTRRSSKCTQRDPLDRGIRMVNQFLH